MTVMTDQDQDQGGEDLIRCPYCGRMTSGKANFCYFCARELKTRPERPAEVPSSGRISWVFVAVIIILVVAFIIIMALRSS
jgi:uncharacterized membrane protein YvbJ